MSAIETATHSLDKVPRGVWLASIGVGGGIGVIYLIRHRNAPAATGSGTDPSAVANDFSTPMATPDFSSSAGFAGDGGSGGASIGAFDPGVSLAPGTNPIPFSTLLDTLTGLWGLLPPGAASTGGGMPVADPNDVHTTPPSVPPPVTPATPTAVPSIAKPTTPAQAYTNQWLQAAQATGHETGLAPAQVAALPTCPPTHPLNAGGNDCYRLVLIGKQRWHYHLDGRKVRVS